MRSDQYVFPHTTTTQGILLFARTVGQGTRRHRRVHIGHEGTELVALAQPYNGAITAALDGALIARNLELVNQGGQPSATPWLLGVVEDPFADGLHHLPESTCQVEGVVLGIKRLVAGTQALPLRTFLTNVFERRDVYSRFWTMPAAAKHHHVYPGGLATHTLEVANDLANHGGLTDLELDLGIAGALLHDIGKVWSYTNDMFLNAAGLSMGHEMVGLSRLEPELVKLEALWPDGAYCMRTLLSGQSRMRENGTLPSSLIPRIKACDQRSCELDRSRNGKPHRTREAWLPRAWDEGASRGDAGKFDAGI